MRKIFILFSVGLFFVFSLQAQDNQSGVELSGTILNKSNEPVVFATIRVLSLNIGSMTDAQGKFAIQLPKQGKYRIQISCLGYNKLEEEISINQSSVTKNWILETNPSQIEAIEVNASSHGSAYRLKPIKAQVINTQAAKVQPTSLIALMNRSSGIRIRKAGGLSTRNDIMLNGFQGRAIRFFRDGIPMDYLGAGFSIALVPVNMLDHVEVYKGVLPAYLGADALGGAVNLVTRKNYKSFADVSYEFGSFNTHRASLNMGYINKNKTFFAGINAFFNYSDNDYLVDVPVVNDETGKSEMQEVRLFHNRLSNYFAEAYLGLSNKTWADELRFTATFFTIDQNFQFGATMDKPFGAARGIQKAFAPSLNYKIKVFRDKLSINQFFAYNNLNVRNIDTLHGHYDWEGNFTPVPSITGERSSSGALSDIDFHYLTSRTNLTYDLSPKHTLNLSVVLNNYTRKGKDPYGHKFKDGNYVLEVPATYNKIVAALGLSSKFLNNRLQNNLIAKVFHYTTDASDAEYDGTKIHTKSQKTEWGIAEGIKYTINTHSFVTLSAETALRLPEMDELFGDGNLKLSNFELKPERSLNVNLGYRNAVFNNYSFEANLFYRYTKNLILLMPINFMYAQSQNVENVKGTGLELDGSYMLFHWLKANANLTYLNQRLVNTGYSITEGSRLKNTPYFFANAGLTASVKNLFQDKDKLNIYWYYSFVREYYLDYIPKKMEPDGFLGLFGKAKIDARNIIPNQSIHTAGVTYHFSGIPLTTAFQVKNILNADVYDHFKIQNPDRSFSIKFNYSL